MGAHCSFTSRCRRRKEPPATNTGPTHPVPTAFAPYSHRGVRPQLPASHWLLAHGPPKSCKHKNCILPGLLPALAACENNPGSCRRTPKPGAVRKPGKVRDWVSSLQQHGHRPHSSLLWSHVELLSVHTVPLGMQPGVLARPVQNVAPPAQQHPIRRVGDGSIPPAAWGCEPGW